MKAGLTSSVVLHVAAIGFGLVSLSSPRPLAMAEVEAFPVDIVPMSELSQVQEGDREAPLAEKAAPVPTEKPQTVPDAREVGNNEVDTEEPPTPEPKPRPVQTAALPPPAPEPAPEPPLPEPEPVAEPQPEPEPAATPATEILPEPTPKQEVVPEPTPETTAATQAPDAEAVKLPDAAPSPQARPQPPKAQTAKAPERKKEEQPAKKQAAAKQESAAKDFDADEVAALLSKEKPSGGGAKRSTETASLGGKKTTSGDKLSQSELDALRGQLAGCWTLPGAGGGDELSGLRATVRFSVDASGKVDGMPVVETSSGNRIFDESALRAIRKCDSRGLLLPKDKAEIWSEIVVNFDPSDMLF